MISAVNYNNEINVCHNILEFVLDLSQKKKGKILVLHEIIKDERHLTNKLFF